MELRNCSTSRKERPDGETPAEQTIMGKKSSESARQGVAGMNAEEFRRERAFEAVFEDAPVAIWYEDFSAIRTFLCELQAKGIDDLPTFLEQAPDTVIECVRR